MRATSTATLPTPTTAARSCERSKLQVPIVGMAVVPGDEFGGGVAALQILAGDAHAPVGLGARRVDDLVIVTPEIRRREIPAELDAAEEPKARMCGHLVEGRGDGLDLLVIGGHAGAHQAVRRGHAVEEIDLDDVGLLLQQMVGGVEAGGPRTDDGDSERSIVRSRVAHGSADSSIAEDGAFRVLDGFCGRAYTPRHPRFRTVETIA